MCNKVKGKETIRRIENPQDPVDNFFARVKYDQNMTKTEVISMMKPTKTDLIAKNGRESRLKSVDNCGLRKIITGYTPTACG